MEESIRKDSNQAANQNDPEKRGWVALATLRAELAQRAGQIKIDIGDIEALLEQQQKATDEIVRSHNEKMKRVRSRFTEVTNLSRENDKKYNQAIADLETENRQLKDQLQRIENQHAQVRSQLQASSSENAQIRENSKKLEKALLETEGRVTNLIRENKVLHDNILKIKELNKLSEDENSAQIDFLTQSLEKNAQERIRSVELKMKSLDASLAASNQEIQKLRMENELIRNKAQNDLQNHSEELDDANSRNARLSEKIIQLEKENLSLRGSIQNLNTAHAKERSEMEIRLLAAEQRATPFADNEERQSTIVPDLEVEKLQMLQQKLEEQRRNAQKIKSEIKTSIQNQMDAATDSMRDNFDELSE